MPVYGLLNVDGCVGGGGVGSTDPASSKQMLNSSSHQCPCCQTAASTSGARQGRGTRHKVDWKTVSLKENNGFDQQQQQWL